MTDDLHQTVRAALRTSSALTDDCPNLFLRVTWGVERRRRRHRTTAGAVVAVAVGVALAVPSLAQVGAGHTTISAEGSTGLIDSLRGSCANDSTLPSNSFLRRAEAIDGTTCNAPEPSTIPWVHTAQRYGLLQP